MKIEVGMMVGYQPEETSLCRDCPPRGAVGCVEWIDEDWCWCEFNGRPCPDPDGPLWEFHKSVLRPIEPPEESWEQTCKRMSYTPPREKVYAGD